MPRWCTHAVPMYTSQVRITAKRALRDALDQGSMHDLDAVREDVRRSLTRFFFNALGKRVVCMVMLHVVRE